MTNERTHDCDDVRPLLALRVSDDLLIDEAERVDRHLRYCPECKGDLESHRRVLDLLQANSSGPVGLEQRPSLWTRIEPRLGPAGRWRPRPLPWVTTRQLAAACLALFALTIYVETNRGPKPIGTPAFVPQSPATLSPVGDTMVERARPRKEVPPEEPTKKSNKDPNSTEKTSASDRPNKPSQERN